MNAEPRFECGPLQFGSKARDATEVTGEAWHEVAHQRQHIPISKNV